MGFFFLEVLVDSSTGWGRKRLGLAGGAISFENAEELESLGVEVTWVLSLAVSVTWCERLELRTEDSTGSGLNRLAGGGGEAIASSSPGRTN